MPRRSKPRWPYAPDWSLLVEDGICVTCQMDRISQGKDTLAEMYEDISSHSRVYIDEN